MHFIIKMPPIKPIMELGPEPSPKTITGPVTHNVVSRYLKRDALQELLEELFPGQKDFKITQLDDQWRFTAPRKVEDEEIDKIREDY
ncbi:hypothetical protein B0T17DRAFT_528135 [Bombardia bombarda]|uniref:Uncharacterized protein n=1 Tax=Bombardia bombarda TaxID=252184 RepID=A0AA39XAG2_9PEZI|nr:hypothetical protein B0T17DRAFT_528135 [Bombardia bombarda]